jgi:hypothetical protein
MLHSSSFASMHSFRRIGIAVAVLAVLATGAAWAQNEPPCCLVNDNGFGTATLPPVAPVGCVYTGSMAIIDGLVPGSTLQIAATIGGFFNVVEAPGGGLGGTQSNFDGFISMQMTGTGVYTGYNHFVSFPLTSERIDWAPRIGFSPLQTLVADWRRLQGQIFVDPEFDLLRVTGGGDFGLPSPGWMQLAQSGPQWALSSFFDITWRIDFVGDPIGTFGGRSGSTTGTSRFSMCPESAIAVQPTAWSAVKSLYKN